MKGFTEFSVHHLSYASRTQNLPTMKSFKCVDDYNFHRLEILLLSDTTVCTESTLSLGFLFKVA